VDLQAAGLIPLGVEELQGQYRLLDAVQALRGVQIGNGGGLLPEAVIKDSVEFWPAMRPQVIYDFTRYMDGTPTQKGDVIWLVNVMKMPDGRKSTANTRDGRDPLYQVPLMKIVIGDDAPDNSAEHWSANFQGSRPSLVTQTPFPAGFIDNLRRRPMKLQRSGVGGEIEWVINGAPFDMTVPMFQMVQGQPEIFDCETGGGWDHPMHFHQEEFRILSRSLGFMDDDNGKDDVLEMRAGEKIEIYKNFRSFTGKYVAHCHQLAHEDHAMMFGYTILPPGSTPVGAEDPRGPVGTFG
jgi:FtsP/CotA-like multicopper oxidase with cupredoxin domain